MARLLICAVLAVIGLGLAAIVIEIDTDLRAVLGDAAGTRQTMEEAAALQVTGIVTGGTQQARAGLTARLQRDFARHSLVEQIQIGPQTPSPALLDLLWEQRFVLAPPAEGAFGPAEMAAELAIAKDMLTDPATSHLAGRMLLDPTGSYRRLLAGLAQQRSTTWEVSDGLFVTADGQAHLFFLKLASEQFEVDSQAQLDRQMQEAARENGLTLSLVGLRPIRARVSTDIERRAVSAAVLGGLGILLWLGYTLRRVSCLGFLLLPVGIGLATATLTTQLFFGNVHVLALGFGGTLIGLAVDYPIHQMGHAGTRLQKRRAARLIALGCATTIVTFMALLLVDVGVVRQIGVFASSGLGGAALACWLLRGQAPVFTFQTMGVTPRLILFHGKVPTLGVASLSLAGLLGFSAPLWKEEIMSLPTEIKSELAEADRLLDLPSGRYAIEVRGSDLSMLLQRQQAIAPVLRALRAEGMIERSLMLTDLLPLPSQSAPSPPTEGLLVRAERALTAAGLNPAFAVEIDRATRQAWEQPPLGASSWDAQLGALLPQGVLGSTGDQLSGRVQLWGIDDPRLLRARIEAMGEPHIHWLAPTNQINRELTALSKRSLAAVLFGALVALSLLVLASRHRRETVEIALACIAATLVTTCLLALSGGLSIFHILALGLVIGIGLDHGLFLTTSCDQEEFERAVASVAVCSVTTAIGFGAMAFSGVEILRDMAITVLLGLSLTLLAHSTRGKTLQSGQETRP